MRPWIAAEGARLGGRRGGAGPPAGDVLVLAVRLREPHGYAEARVGRFVLATGAVHPVQIDGAHVDRRARRGAPPWRPSAGFPWSRASGRAATTGSPGVASRRRSRAPLTLGRLVRAAARGRRDLERRGRRGRRAAPVPLARRRRVRRLRPRRAPGSRRRRASAAVRSERLAPRALRIAALARQAAAGDVALLGARRLAVADGRGDRPVARRAPARPARERRRSGRRGRSRRQRMAARDAATRRRGDGSLGLEVRRVDVPGAAVDGRARHRGAAPRQGLSLLDRDRDRRARPPGRTRRRVALGALGAVVAIASTAGRSRAPSRRPSTPLHRYEADALVRLSCAFDGPPGPRRVAVRSRPPDEGAPSRVRAAVSGSGRLRERARPSPRVAVASVRAPRARAQGHQLRRVPRRRGARGRDGTAALSDRRRLPALPREAPRRRDRASGATASRTCGRPRSSRARSFASTTRRHMGAVNGDCVRCHTEVAEARPETVLPKMATCFGCHEHREQWTLRDCDGCHVDLPREGTPPDDHLVHDGDFIREHGVRAASARDLCASCHTERQCASCHGEGTVPALPWKLALDDVGLSGLHRAGFLRSPRRRGARRPRALHDVPHRELVRRLPHARERRAGRRRDSPHPPGLGERRARRAGAHRSRRRARAATAGAGEQLCVGCHRVGGPGGNPHGPGFASRGTSTTTCRAGSATGSVDDADRATRALAALAVAGRDRRGVPSRRSSGSGRADPTACRPSSFPRRGPQYRDDPRAPDARRAAERPSAATATTSSATGSRTPARRSARTATPRRPAVAHHGSPIQRDRLPDVPRVRARTLRRRRASAATPSPQGSLPAIVQHATVDCTTVPPPARDAVDRPGRLHELPRRAGDEARRARGLDGLPRLPSAATSPRPRRRPRARRATRRPREPHPAGHDACIGCHAAPRLRRRATARASAATARRPRWPSSEVRLTRVCINCHMPHAPGNAAAACVAVPPGRPGDPRKRGGVRHLPRAPRRRSGRRRRSAARAATRRWPASDTGAHAGGIACEACHKPHAFGGLDEKTLCRDCHARETTLVAVEPRPRRLHLVPRRVGRPCASRRRRPAGPATPPSRSPRRQATSAAWAATSRTPGSRRPRAPPATRQDDRRAAHGDPGGCATCHRPHGPERRRGSARLHDLPRARPRCPRSMPPPATPRARAATCRPTSRPATTEPHARRTCHADKRDHQPGAQVCTGCHVFRR